MTDDKLLEEARERFDMAVDAESELREDMLDDMRFEAGDQWPDRIKHVRENDPDGPRPCLTINLTKKHKLSLLNDVRRNRPAIKVMAVDDKADVETAKVLNGLLRHIQSVSDADIATDTAADHQITSGLGYFRIGTEVIDQRTNEQEVRISPILNPFSVYMDPFADHPAGADAQWCFVTEEMPRKKFKLMYPDSEAADWDGGNEEISSWYPDEDTIRVAEYYCIKEERKDGYDETNSSWSKEKRCVWYKIAGTEILDTRELPTSYIPIIRVAGEERRVDSHRDFRGIVRDLRDPQRMYNYWTSANTEMIALSPKAPYLVPAEAVEGHEDSWANANTSNAPYLPYNQFEAESGERLNPPSRSPASPMNQAIVQSMLQAAEDMRSVSGQSQSAFGEKSNEQSGRAINARRSEQDNNTFHYVDNLSRSMKHAGRIILEMIPFIYDTRRVVRILGEDDSVDFATLDPDQPRSMMEAEDINGGIQQIYNPGIGRYDVRVTVGPAYATRAEEGAERLSQLIQAAPDLMAIAGDLLFKNMDIPGADELSERMGAMLPPQVAQLAQARKGGQEQGMQQAEMVREQMIAEIAPKVEQLQMALQEAGQEVDQLMQANEQLQVALKDKQAEHMLKEAELSLKAREMEMDRETKMADSEAEVAVAYIQAQGNQKEEEGERKESGNGSAREAAEIASAVTSQAMRDTQAQAQQMSEAHAGMMEQLERVAEAAASAMEQAQALAQRVEAGDEKRAEMAQLASGLLTGELTDEEAAAALAGRLN